MGTTVSSKAVTVASGKTDAEGIYDFRFAGGGVTLISLMRCFVLLTFEVALSSSRFGAVRCLGFVEESLGVLQVRQFLGLRHSLVAEYDLRLHRWPAGQTSAGILIPLMPPMTSTKTQVKGFLRGFFAQKLRYLYPLYLRPRLARPRRRRRRRSSTFAWGTRRTLAAKADRTAPWPLPTPWSVRSLASTRKKSRVIPSSFPDLRLAAALVDRSPAPPAQSLRATLQTRSRSNGLFSLMIRLPTRR